MESQSLTKTDLKDTPTGGFGNNIEGKKLQTASSKGSIVLLETPDMTSTFSQDTQKLHRHCVDLFWPPFIGLIKGEANRAAKHLPIDQRLFK